MQSEIEPANQPSSQFFFPGLLLLYQRVIVKSNSASTGSSTQPTDVFPRLPHAQVVGEGFGRLCVTAPPGEMYLKSTYDSTSRQ